MSDLINGLRHMADDHPCCRETLQLTIDTIEELERDNAALRADVLEQCTLNAKGGEREYVLLGKVEQLRRELATEREKAERYRLVTLRQDAELADWRDLAIWGGTPEVIHEFIRSQQNRIHHTQDLETELAALRNKVARLENQSQWECACGGTDYKGQKENATLRSLLRESLEYIDQYDYEEAFDMVQRIKAALKEGKP